MKQKTNFKAVLFDIDNTLYDSKKLSENARNAAIDSMIDAGLNSNHKEALDTLKQIVTKYGSNYRFHFDKLVEKINMSWSAKIVAAGIVSYHNSKFSYLKTKPGVFKMLLFLKKNKILTGIVTDGLLIKQWEKLIRLNIADFFDSVIVSEEIGVEKPEKKIFQAYLKELNIKPEETIMVGDKYDRDIIGALNCGIFPILINSPDIKQKINITSKKSFKTVNSIIELHKFLKTQI